MRLRVQPLASLSGSRIQCCLELWCRSQTRLALLWLWRRPKATALIRSLAWEPPYATGVALEKPKSQKAKKKKKKKERKEDKFCTSPCVCLWKFTSEVFKVFQGSRQFSLLSLCLCLLLATHTHTHTSLKISSDSLLPTHFSLCHSNNSFRFHCDREKNY